MRFLQKLEPLAEGEIFKDERLMDTRKETKPVEANAANMPARLAVVPARLLGSVRSAIVGQRPWTRLECTRLLNEANDLPQSANVEDHSDALGIYDAGRGVFEQARPY